MASQAVVLPPSFVKLQPGQIDETGSDNSSTTFNAPSSLFASAALDPYARARRRFARRAAIATAGAWRRTASGTRTPSGCARCGSASRRATATTTARQWTGPTSWSPRAAAAVLRAPARALRRGRARRVRTLGREVNGHSHHGIECYADAFLCGLFRGRRGQQLYISARDSSHKYAPQDVKLLCDHGKGSRDKHQQNILCECPLAVQPVNFPNPKIPKHKVIRT